MTLILNRINWTVDWIDKGITTFYSITDMGQLKDFQTLKDEHVLDKQDFFRYFQLRHYYDQTVKKYPLDMDDPVLKEFRGAYTSKLKRGIISRLYKGLMSKQNHSTEYIKKKGKRKGIL